VQRLAFAETPCAHGTRRAHTGAQREAGGESFAQAQQVRDHKVSLCRPRLSPAAAAARVRQLSVAIQKPSGGDFECGANVGERTAHPYLKERPGAAEAREHLVKDEQHAVLVTQVPQCTQPTLGRRPVSPTPLNGLHEDGGR
jgi:hypothetical protein